MSVQCIGRSVRRAPIWSFSIENPTVESRYTVLVFAQLHALEWLGPEVIVELTETLTESAPQGVRVVLVPSPIPTEEHELKATSSTIGSAYTDGPMPKESTSTATGQSTEKSSPNGPVAVHGSVLLHLSRLSRNLNLKPSTSLLRASSPMPLSPSILWRIHLLPMGGFCEDAPDKQELHRLARSC